MEERGLRITVVGTFLIVVAIVGAMVLVSRLIKPKQFGQADEQTTTLQ